MKLKLADQPVAYSAAFKAVLAAIVIIGVVSFTGSQVAALSVAFDSLLGVFVFASVQPNTKVDAKVAEASTKARHEALSDVASLADPPPAAAV